MLPLLNLDDRMFKQIVEESKKMIPKLAPQWTDENYHDPGVTFIELFAWLTEMQQYYLNRITSKNELKFLKLMGIKPGEATTAIADVTFGGVSKELYLPVGTRLAAGEQPFETDEPLLLLPAKIEKIIVFSDSDSIDCTLSNSYENVNYHAFGREAKRGNRFYIGFDRELPLGRNIRLTFKLYEGYPVPMGELERETDLIPSAKVSWKYYGVDTGGGNSTAGWFALKVVRDETLHLSRSGTVEFQVLTQMRLTKIHPANDKSRFWLCCTVVEEGYEIPPRLEQILLNTVTAVQRKTLSEVISFSSSGRRDMVFKADSSLSLTGINKVQVRTGQGDWRYWKEARDLSFSGADDLFYTLNKSVEEKKIVIRFGDGKCGKIPPEGRDNIRLISYLPSFEGDRFLGKSSGLPNQLFQMYGLSNILQTFMLQVGKNIPGSKEYIWQDWERVDDFDTSKPADQHYALNGETGELLFSNNENGMIPDSSEGINVCIISCQTGGGDRGNVKENEINMIASQAEELQAITVANYYPASGGAAKETLDDAKRRIRRELKRQFRAVTTNDFEDIARGTPGLRVARVKAIPLYEAGLKDYPQNKAPAQVTVAVVPYSESKKPVPSDGFLETVRRHLNRYRLITTEVHVIPPEYIKINVNAVVVVEPYIKFDPGKIVDALDRLLHPLDSPDGAKGWPFGRTVYKGDILGALNHIVGVEYIKELWLAGEGTDVRKTQSGDIQIPPHGLVYSGEHDIEIVSLTDL